MCCAVKTHTQNKTQLFTAWKRDLERRAEKKRQKRLATLRLWWFQTRVVGATCPNNKKGVNKATYTEPSTAMNTLDNTAINNGHSIRDSRFPAEPSTAMNTLDNTAINYVHSIRDSRLPTWNLVPPWTHLTTQLSIMVTVSGTVGFLRTNDGLILNGAMKKWFWWF